MEKLVYSLPIMCLCNVAVRSVVAFVNVIRSSTKAIFTYRQSWTIYLKMLPRNGLNTKVPVHVYPTIKLLKILKMYTYVSVFHRCCFAVL